MYSASAAPSSTNSSSQERSSPSISDAAARSPPTRFAPTSTDSEPSRRKDHDEQHQGRRTEAQPPQLDLLQRDGRPLARLGHYGDQGRRIPGPPSPQGQE